MQRTMSAALESAAHTPAALWQAFAARAEALGATVVQAAGEAEAADILAGAASAGEVSATRGLAERFPRAAAACGGPAAAAMVASLRRPESGAAIQAAPQVAAAALFAIAETGSAALCEDNAGRGACFLAERLWLLVPEDAIVPTLEDALARLAALARAGTPYATIMSGPSRTADIERTLTIGVHGPRELAIVVVRDGARAAVAGAAPEPAPPS